MLYKHFDFQLPNPMECLDTIFELVDANIFQQVEMGTLDFDRSQIRKCNLKANEIILSPSSINKEIFVLVQGELVICLQEKNGHPIARIKPGDCVGEISLIDDQPPSAYVKTACPSVLVAIHRDALSQMYEQQPVLAVNLLKMLASRFRENTDVLVNSIKMQKEYQDKAERDTLTGLHNRGWMNDVFPRQLELSERIGQRVTMLMIDADHFKRINDNHGHLIGDKALNHLTQIIKDNLRETDLLVRFGGEELVALMPGTILSRAHAVSERIRVLVEATPLILSDEVKINLTISIGMAECQSGEQMTNLLERADQALYQAKSNGRNQTTALH